MEGPSDATAVIDDDNMSMYASEVSPSLCRSRGFSSYLSPQSESTPQTTAFIRANGRSGKVNLPHFHSSELTLVTQNQEEPNAKVNKSSDDFLGTVNNLYRILELISEQGSGGLGEIPTSVYCANNLI